VRYGSVCSGIEAASVAWHPLGWEPAWFCEIEPFPCAVLSERFPNVPNYGDFTQMIDPNHEVHRGPAIDVLVGGTPCQDFSVAGLRAGIAGERGGLTLEFLRLARVLRPRWIVWENVPGVLSSDGGRALGAFVGGLAELGYGFAWRVLDAQYVRVDGYPGAVPQRRRRIFVVGHSSGDARRAGQVLLEPEGVRGNPAPRREARKGATAAAAGGFEVCGTLSDGAHNGGGLNGQDAYTGRILPVAFDTTQITSPSNCSRPQPGDPCHPLAAGAHPPAIAFDARQADVLIYGDKTGPLDTDGHSVGVLTAAREVAGTLDANYGKGPGERGGAEREYVQQDYRVRRLTPVECERLQGFPDDYTRIPWRGKPAAECPDGPRYRALGNSMACNVMRWIGRRIEMVEART
jgi:DNA (cytosine-5)-methyltransferase 1